MSPHFVAGKKSSSVLRWWKHTLFLLENYTNHSNSSPCLFVNCMILLINLTQWWTHFPSFSLLCCWNKSLHLVKKHSNLMPWHHRDLLLRHPRGLFGHRHSRLGWEHGGSCCWDFPWMVGKSPRTRQSMVLTLFKHGLDMFKHGLDKFKLKVFRFLMLPPFQSHTNIKYLPPDLLGVGLQPGLTTADRHWDEIIGMIPRLLG